MKRAIQLSHLILVLVLILAACTSVPATGGDPTDSMADTPAATDAMMDENDDEMMEGETKEVMEDNAEMMAESTPTHDAMMDETMPTDDAMMEPEEGAMMDAPAWFGVPLTDVRSGETFTLADLQGKVVLVENMAIWCTTCFRQQSEVVKLHEMLGESPDFVSIALDIDPNENSEQLKDYSEKNGFDWVYVVAPAEVSREIGNLYGDQFLNPPSAPMLLIDREGNVRPLKFGVKSVDELKTAVDALLKEGM